MQQDFVLSPSPPLPRKRGRKQTEFAKRSRASSLLVKPGNDGAR
jgi:hypothetical protein